MKPFEQQRCNKGVGNKTYGGANMPEALILRKAMAAFRRRSCIWRQCQGFRMSAAIAAICMVSSAALAQGAEPTDPQIAHIAYTAGQLDIEGAKQALSKSKNKYNINVQSVARY